MRNAATEAAAADQHPRPPNWGKVSSGSSAGQDRDCLAREDPPIRCVVAAAPGFTATSEGVQLSADAPVMPTRVSQMEWWWADPPYCGRHNQSASKGEERVRGAVAAALRVGRLGPCQRSLFESEVGMQVDLGGVDSLVSIMRVILSGGRRAARVRCGGLEQRGRARMRLSRRRGLRCRVQQPRRRRVRRCRAIPSRSLEGFRRLAAP